MLAAMDFSLAAKDFSAAVHRCTAATNKTSAMPVLATVLLRAGPGEVTVTGTDLYNTVAVRVAADVARPGAYCLDGVDLAKRIQAMPGGVVQIVQAPPATPDTPLGPVKIQAVGTRRAFVMSGIPAHDYPNVEASLDATPLALPAGVLTRLLRQVMASISTDETRAHVNCARVELKGSSARMVSTDGHRLTLATATLPDKALPCVEALLSRAAAGILRKLLEEVNPATDVSLRFASPSLVVSVGNVTFTTKLVDAAFPPYQQVVPAPRDVSYRVARLPLLDMVKAVAIASDTHGIRLTFGQDNILAEGNNAELGSGSDEIGCVAGPGAVPPAFVAAFNSSYLRDALSVTDVDEVALTIDGELSPLVIKPVGADEPSYLAVVMPMRV